jgi:hypothetical protein
MEDRLLPPGGTVSNDDVEKEIYGGKMVALCCVDTKF